ncbi:hypothetical protein MKQ70_12160 [Chitinophaga sedimenti]|uniref:hypothetical protein n=1 Tax=Chitinophaga sedimenti TaxID=2033606 RepID=UPI0020068A91|nr:hypothetical protein [Chitinophaga sedimenti]MCK7555729.1 hypothetical protein [Chitinophaga sedimenti]
MIDFKAPIVGANMSFDHRNVGKDMLYMDRGYLLNTHSFSKIVRVMGTGYM